jgi:hypothetical protein
MQHTYSGKTRAEAIRRIFTEGVKNFAEEHHCPMGQALAELAQENPDLWREYCADSTPVQGILLENPASATLASEMNTYAEKHRVSLAVALCEVSKAKPSLYKEYLDGIAIVV